MKCPLCEHSQETAKDMAMHIFTEHLPSAGCGYKKCWCVGPTTRHGWKDGIWSVDATMEHIQALLEEDGLLGHIAIAALTRER